MVKETPQTRADAASPVTQAQLSTRLDKFGVDLTTKINLAIAAAVAESIETLKIELDSTKKEFADFVQLNSEIVEALKARIVYLESTALAQSLWNNEKEQRHRNKTCRLHNHRSSATDAPSSMLDSYIFIVKPAFERAVAAGELDSVPPLFQCLEFGHPLRPRSTGDVPAILIKFLSRNLFNIFLKFGRLIIDEINKTRGNLEKVRLGRDLTMLNRRAMTYICRHNLTDKVRLSGSTVQYTMKSDPEVWLSVENPTGSCLADMRRKVVDPLMKKISDELRGSKVASVVEDTAVVVAAEPEVVESAE